MFRVLTGSVPEKDMVTALHCLVNHILSIFCPTIFAFIKDDDWCSSIHFTVNAQISRESHVILVRDANGLAWVVCQGEKVFKSINSLLRYDRDLFMIGVRMAKQGCTVIGCSSQICLAG
jgi:hypothetical protein